MKKVEWPVAFFDDDYLEIYRPMFSEEATRAEVDFIEAALAVPAGGAVLDLACGFGRHAVRMAARGYRVTGVDFNERYLQIAEAEAQRMGQSVRWIAGDMRALELPGPFAGAYSYFTSFGYYSDAENEQVLERVVRALAPSGRFLLDVVNRDWILTHPQQRVWSQRPDGSILMEEVTLDLVASRVVTRQRLVAQEGGMKLTKEYDLRAYTCAELRAMFDRHGLDVIEVWGGADRSAYSTDSRRLVLLGSRRA